MASKLKRISSIFAVLLLSVAAIVTGYCTGTKIPDIKTFEGKIPAPEIPGMPDEGVPPFLDDSASGEGLTKIYLHDIEKTGRITKVNYYPDKFLDPYAPMKGGIVADLTDPDFEFANKGTLQFVFLQPDPTPSHAKDREMLDKLYRKDYYWEFTLDIPPVFSACNIYAQNSGLKAEVGEISDYDFAKFNNYFPKKTGKYRPKAAHSYIDLKFSTSPMAFSPEISAQNLVTLHYEKGTSGTGIMFDLPVVGREEDILSFRSRMVRLYAFAATLAGVILAISVFTAFLKHNGSNSPVIMILTGCFFTFISSLILHNSNSLPVLYLVIRRIAPLYTLFACVHSVIKAPEKSIPRLVNVIVFILLSVLTAITPLVPFKASAVLNKITAASRVLEAVYIIISVFYLAAAKSSPLKQYIPPFLIAVSVCGNAVLAAFNFSSSAVNATFGIVFIAIMIIAAVNMQYFMQLEKVNKNLTANLQTEVNIRTGELKKMLKERNRLLQYISHDLRKPLNFFSNSLGKLKTSMDAGENADLIDILLQKNKETDSFLKKIAGLSKLDFISEPLKVTDINAFAEKICEGLSPDCEANGVRLSLKTCKKPGKLKVYAKADGLKSTVMNIIFNALEHSGCTEIEVITKKQDKKVLLAVHDNGKGLGFENGTDIFLPYVSTEKGADRGLGLYMAKQTVESMGGNISCESVKGSTDFIITLPEFRPEDMTEI